MLDLKYEPAQHDHEAFLEKAFKCQGFRQAYASLEVKYALVRKRLKSAAPGRAPFLGAGPKV